MLAAQNEASRVCLGDLFAVRIEEFLAALLPRRFEFGGCDVPVRPAFLGNGT